MIGMTYVDAMDETRHVRPVKDLGSQYECEVFWFEEGRSFYGGKTKIGKKLFEESLSYVGFRPWNPEPIENASAPREDDGDDRC